MISSGGVVTTRQLVEPFINVPFCFAALPTTIISTGVVSKCDWPLIRDVRQPQSRDCWGSSGFEVGGIVGRILDSADRVRVIAEVIDGEALDIVDWIRVWRDVSVVRR